MSDNENVCDNEVRRSSRRRETAKTTSRKSALESLKEARAQGKGYRPNLEVEDVYEMVDEDEYNSIVSKRQNDNFVVDDDGMGYVDTGVDFEEEYEDDYDHEKPASKKGEKKEKKAKKEKKKGALDSFFSTGAAKKSMVDDSKVKINLDDDEDLRNMLGDILDGDDEQPATSSAPQPSRNPFKRDRTSSPTTDTMTPRPIAKKAKTSLMNKIGSAAQKQSVLNLKPPNVRIEKKEEIDKVEEDDDFDYGVPDFEPEVVEEPVKAELKQELLSPPQKPNSVPEEEAMEAEDDSEKCAAKFKMSCEQWDVEEEEAPEENVEVKTGSEAFYVMGGENKDTKAVKMYWIDAFEDSHKNTGTVYLFGKLKINDNKWASCCCVVKNIFRQTFFLPRDFNPSTGEPIEQVEVFNEISKVLKRNLNVVNFKCRATEKRLMKDSQFGTSAGERTTVMEVLYESSFPKLPSDLSGDSFSRVFNTTTTSLERLLTEKKFMGPGWIEIYNFTEATAKTSNCDYEFSVDMERMKSIRYLENDANNRELPRVRLLALNILTTLNEAKENEICMISMLYNHRSSFLHPSAYTQNLQRRCLITKPVGGALPFDIRKKLQNENWDELVTTTANEKALLTLFLAKINEMEPDLIVGHDLSATISVLVARLEKLRIPNWSRISRLKRKINIGKVGHSKAGQWELTAGRLLLDSKLAAMELVKSRSYDLTELTMQILGAKRQDIYVNDIGPMFASSDRLVDLIKWSWMDPLLALRIVVQLNALPLFTQITNIVGGVTSRTMMGGRAERNEYLLLHAFHKSDLIAPDKYSSAAKKPNSKSHDQTTIIEDGGEEGEEKKHGKAKAQYSGGLVLEPKKGLYDTLILLLDFNSLYPSIIQEYNICFTTVLHTKDGDDLPEAPKTVNDEGVLPREIRKLVECRRDVKSLMKTEKRDAERKQLDIRQMALKLTANSMYGCLGFQYSRFYAKPLAALITSKGREILMHSKDLVEKLGYSVIYGDTDSIMINTNSVDLAQAKKLGFEIKKAVNKCHRLLELDLDGVFKRMLLLKKKKYAALTINPDTKVEAKELKGLDIVRRDWSQLAKETGAAVVDKVLDTSLSRDEMVSAIDDLLKDIREKLDSGRVPIEMFQISKQLTRNPKDYADLKAQCHAAVAKRLNESGRFNLRHGDIVEYIICEDGTTNPATQRAYHKTEMEDNKELKIDLMYYLAQQIHPVVSRLCAPIEETDAVRIAECLGMDSTNYRRAAMAQANQKADEDDYLWQQDNYDLCEGIVVKCPLKTCGETNIIRDTFDTVTDAESPRLTLSSCGKCQTSWLSDEYLNVIINQIDKQLSGYVGKHLSAGYKCDEPTCEYKTRVQTMKWCREGLECIRCSTGILRREYTSKHLFDQQMFFRNILDVDGAMEKMKSTDCRNAKLRPEFINCRTELAEIRNWLIAKYLEKNSYNRVDLAFIFAPMLKLD